MPLDVRAALRSISFATSLALCLATGCAPTTGQVFVVKGPKGGSSLSSGVAQLELVVAHASYCERWVTDETATGQHYDVSKRELNKSPARLLLVPTHVTNLNDAVRAVVLARDASGNVLGMAPFDAHAFRYEKVDEYNASIELFDKSESDVTTDGCVCAPGAPWIGNGSGTGCDTKLPPSFDALQNTAGCMLQPGEALPVGVCDGQLYPGETENRTVPCYAMSNASCRIGTRTCVDRYGYALSSSCYPDGNGPALPTTTLCDTFATCEQAACGDPLACLKTSTKAHHALACSLPISPTAQGGVLVPCAGGSWSLALGAQTGAACSAAILDGTQLGPVVVGFAETGQMSAQVSSATCPPTLKVDTINVADPAQLASSVRFTFTLGDDLYDVELDLTVACASSGDAANHLRCVGL